MLWTNARVMLRLLALLLTSELVRTGFFVAVLPLVGPRLGLNAGVIGLMVGVHYLMDALAKGPLGLVAERWGVGRLLLLGTLLGGATLGVVNLWPSALLATLLSGVWGLLYAALWPGVMNASHALARPERLARALALSNLSVAPAILAGVLLVGPLTQKDPALAWTVLFAAQALALGLALSLVKLRVQAVGPGANLFGSWQRVGVLLPAAFTQTLAPGLLVTLFYPLLDKLNLKLSGLIAPGLLAACAFALSLGVLGRLADRVHPRRALTPGLLLLALTFGLVAFTDTPPVTDQLWLLAPLLGSGYGAFIAGWNGLVGRTLPEAHRAAGWGTVMTVESLGYAIGPLLGGLTWHLAGQRGVFLLGGAAFLLTELYYLWPARQLSGTPIPEHEHLQGAGLVQPPPAPSATRAEGKSRSS
ncbi:MFS transporter [Deinococcus cavernae]|uniref:MFS transporter n=1 Tax=Deinococcus cavernae TaxID=2320857 RepID=A0A418V8G2_9DEIO|nr:MFS transporter [Deinococcus cavernae]RJF72380.1 MFS transporter [Deinococcus cavernae]